MQRAWSRHGRPSAWKDYGPELDTQCNIWQLCCCFLLQGELRELLPGAVGDQANPSAFDPRSETGDTTSTSSATPQNSSKTTTRN